MGWKAPNKGKTTTSGESAYNSSQFGVVGNSAPQSASTRTVYTPKTGGLRGKYSPTGALDAATAKHRNNVQEHLGPSLHPGATLYKQNAASAGDTLRSTKLVPSSMGNRDFWAKRSYGS